MYHRRDALRGAAQFIVRAHEQIRARYGDGVFNCGDIDVKPGKFNIIPSEARLIVECRHANERLMTEMEMLIVQIAREAAAGNGLVVDSQPIARMPVAPMNPQVLEAVTAACDRLGLSHIPLISYSGHDAQIISRITPSAMIFIPSQRGISHRPEEFTPWQDVINGANVLLQTVLRLAFVTDDGEAGT
jgi:N-carbamoyl-L-amino-acid hydrolase